MTNERLYQIAREAKDKASADIKPWLEATVDAVAAAVRAECHIDLEPFRAPVKYWRATAHLGELALDYRHRYLNSVEVYKARVAEADRLLAVIDAAVAQQEPTK